MARQKSLHDIRKQYQRILSSGDWNRIAQASEIANRYERNIKNTPLHKAQSKQFHQAWVGARTPEVMALARAINNQKYSQRTYMGLSNG